MSSRSMALPFALGLLATAIRTAPAQAGMLEEIIVTAEKRAPTVSTWASHSAQLLRSVAWRALVWRVA